jgi:hypothetical protein
MGAATASAVEPLASAVGDRPSIGDNRGNRQSGLAMPASAGNLRVPVAPPHPTRDSQQRRSQLIVAIRPPYVTQPGEPAWPGEPAPVGRRLARAGCTANRYPFLMNFSAIDAFSPSSGMMTHAAM